MPHVIIVGQAPSRTTDGALALSGRCGEKLAQLAGFENAEQLARAARLVNLVDRYPGTAGKGDYFPRRLGRVRATTLFRELQETRGHTIVVLLGDAVYQSFFSYRRFPYFARDRFRDRAAGVLDFYRVPHPSTVNRWWNEPANVRRARRFFRRIFDAKAS